MDGVDASGAALPAEGTRLVDFNWKLLWVLSHSNVSNANIPLVQLHLTLDVEGREQESCIELQESELDAVIQALESASESLHS
mmetsp:Transcript_867/g.3155  ORF Transcript_867/g.3155 Transcript_867/m.3155 type:complete len:83 (+) Transcript_867:26-274(+)